MISITIQTCGFVLLALIAFFYFRCKKLSVKSRWTFLALLIAAICCTLSDVASVFAICYSYKISLAAVKFFCKLYVVFLVLTVYAGFLYICSDLYQVDRTFAIHAIASSVILAPILCLMTALPIQFKCEGGGSIVYSYGPAVWVTYATCATLFVVMVGYLIAGRKKMNVRRKLSMAVWLALWSVAAIVQLIIPNFLIVTFAGSLGVFIIFITTENPELSMDRSCPFFHLPAMEEYFRERYYNSKKFSMLKTRFDENDIEFYKKVPHRHIFIGNGYIYFVYKFEEDMKKGLEELDRHVEKEKIYVLQSSMIASSQPELRDIVKGAEHLYKDNRYIKICNIDQKLIEKLDDIARTRELIESAIDEDRIEVFYQPIYSVKDKKFTCAEALVRIRDADGNIVPPGKFIPLAEDDGTIINLGKIVFDKTCRFISSQNLEQLKLNYVEVNLSVVQGEDVNLADDVLSTMDKYGVSAEKINLEITESASAQGRERLLENMGKLINKGIDFSLDDFGTGQSNLDYMASMPVKIVKFDRSMTQSYFQSEKTRYIMDVAIKMVREMGLKVVAEGIETKEQFNKMAALGVEYIQGYYFSKPIPQEDFVSFLKANN